jgi:hypothetical protein
MNSAYPHSHIETDLTIEIIEFESGEENKNIDTCPDLECSHGAWR